MLQTGAHVENSVLLGLIVGHVLNFNREHNEKKV